MSKSKMQKKKPYVKTTVLGVFSLASYIALFMNQGIIMEQFTRGGVYAALPIATAFYFSFLHGAFASNLISVMGLEAKKK